MFGLVDQGWDDASCKPCDEALEAQYGSDLRSALACPPPTPLSACGRGLLRVLRVDLADSRGPVAARAAAGSLLRPEDEYYLQIDSHSIFGPRWDARVIAMLHEAGEVHNRRHGCGRGEDHVVVSAYPNEYTQAMFDCNDDLPCVLAASRRDAFATALGAPNVAINCLSFVVKATRLTYHQGMGFPPTEKTSRYAPLWAAGFSFSTAQTWRDVPYVEGLDFLFHGEELLHAARMWTRGIDIFAPSSNVIYHKYAHRHSPSVYTSVAYTNRRSVQDLSVARVKSILSAPLTPNDAHALATAPPLPPSSALGQARSIDQFWAFTGINISSLTFSQRCIDHAADGAYLNLLPPIHA